MSVNKKYYYMKLKENFFDSDDMIILESMPDGMLYSNILIKLYLKSLKYNGKLMFKDTIPYNPQMIATVTRHQVGTVEKALTVFKDLGLIEILSNGALYMNEIELFIGQSSTEGERKKKARLEMQQQNLLPLEHNGHLSDICPPELEIEKEKEIELELEKELEINKDTLSSGKPNNVAEVMEKAKQLENLPNVRAFTDKRKKAINARIEEYGFQEVMNTLDKMNNLAFFKDNKKSSWYTIDWVFNPNNFIKVIEGKYDGLNFNKPAYNNKSYQPYQAEQREPSKKEIIEVDHNEMPF